MLMAVSVSVAGLGWFLAYLLYSRRPQLPARIAASLGGLYQAVAHKYYIDELYAVLFIKPVIDGSTEILWHDVDQGMIDATVNNSADAARHLSDSARHMQSGNLRSYAGWVAAGGAVVIAYMVWMGVTH
jgi:NADH-quinone oxidoreductase subunit L